MKPKTFTYNQIITFFIANNLPLSKQQISLIAHKVREEFNALEAHRKVEKEKQDRAFLKKERKRRTVAARKAASTAPAFGTRATQTLIPAGVPTGEKSADA